MHWRRSSHRTARVDAGFAHSSVQHARGSAALGTEVQVPFCNDGGLANDLLVAMECEQDPFWRLPLHQPYRTRLDSEIADLSNTSKSVLYSRNHGSAISEGIFTYRDSVSTFCSGCLESQDPAQSGSKGGEAITLRAVFSWLEQRYGA